VSLNQTKYNCFPVSPAQLWSQHG